MLKKLVTLSRRRESNSRFGASSAFTIVELLIVIVVIGILAAITIVSYNGITKRAQETALKSDLSSAAKQLVIEKVNTGSFPADSSSLKHSDGTTFTYTSTNSTYCLSATSSALSGVSFYITEAGTPQEGACEVALYMQTVTDANCSTTRTLAVDARDQRSYWIQKMADGKCWMLTNLAYAGGGTNTYNDTRSLQDGTSDGAYTYSSPKYYIHTSANPTSNSTQPSLTTDGGATNPQYGYLYNWCAAMGAQTSTATCANATTPAFDADLSVCPSGWRLPSNNTNLELPTLTSSLGVGNNTAGSTTLRTEWYAQYAGYWNAGFSGQGTRSNFWSRTQNSASQANSLYIASTSVVPMSANSKYLGVSVRCIAI